MIYVDNALIPMGRMKMCHMLADSTEELMDAAKRLGLKPEWVQCPGTWKEHFDISLSKREMAVRVLGARELSARETVLMIRSRREGPGEPRKTKGTSKEKCRKQEAGSRKEYRFIDLFAGIGGFRFGFEPKGGGCIWSCEINPHSRRTYARNHNTREDEIFPDVRDAVPEVIPDHDILIAGFDCSPFSKARVSKNNSMGRPHGFADETRGTLFFEVVRILASHRPKAFLLENVPHLVNHDQGRTFGTVMYLLKEELGYQVSHRIIDARPWVPQRRRRIFIAGHKEKDKPGLHQLDLPDENEGPALFEIIHPEDGTETVEEPYTAGALAEVHKRYTLGPGTWETLRRHRAKHQSAGNGFGYTIARPQDAARTLTARYGKDGQEILLDRPGAAAPRKLTPRECARFMGMPKLVIPVSDTQAYRQLGRSVVPPLVETIAAQMME